VCSDRNGNVYLPAYNPRYVVDDVFEYAHSGTTPIATLTEPNHDYVAVFPVGCSVDPTTGNLTVANTGKERGNTVIFVGAKGSPEVYTDLALHQGFKYCAYDNKGNPVASAAESNSFAELPSCSSSFTNLVINEKFATGQVQCDGKYITIRPVWKTERLDVSGSTVTAIDRILLGLACDGSYWIHCGMGHTLNKTKNSRIWLLALPIRRSAYQNDYRTGPRQSNVRVNCFSRTITFSHSGARSAI
jgi:hypothetical protein